MNIGIIGYGSFGKLLVRMLSKNFPVLVYDSDDSALETEGVKKAEFAQVAKARVVILAVNLNALESVCDRLQNHVSEDTLVIEVCSTKTDSVKILDQYLQGKCQYLATHPLFGPQSVDNKKAKKIVICHANAKEKNKIYEFLKNFLNLEIIEMSAEEHDKQMAWVHALTFFVGRGLMELDLVDYELKTDYYQKLLDLVELEKEHSIELFNTVERGNPYSKEVRDKFLKKLQEINTRLDGEEKWT